MFGESTDTQEVYEVAARPVVKTAMEGVNGMFSFTQILRLDHSFVVINDIW